jgi:hypothetical protein
LSLGVILAALLAAFLAAFLPVGQLAAAPGARQPLQQTPVAIPFYAVSGAFEHSGDPEFTHAFVTLNGQSFTAVGVTAAVERQISDLARQKPPIAVKIWGTRYFDPRPEGVAELVVTEIYTGGDDDATSTPTLTPTPTSTPTPRPTATSTATPRPPTAIVKYSLVALFVQPTQATGTVGMVAGGRNCRVDRRTTDATWLYVDCGGTRGWIDRRLVDVIGNLDAVPSNVAMSIGIPILGAGGPPPPIPTPIATPLPTAAVFTAWKSSFFANTNLSGAPVAYADEQNVDLNWGTGSPHAAVPADYFSARFERTLDLAQGYYTFIAQADDGVRVYVDGEIVIDEWHGASGQTYAAGRWLSGRHQLRIEFLELLGLASIRFGYQVSAQEPPWQASYYNGAPGRGELLYSQREAAGTPIQLDRNWSYGSPQTDRVPADYWNGRWIGRFKFDGGNYYFRARAEDGVRVYIDQQLVIDAWSYGPVDRTNRFIGIGSGEHTVTVDYFEQVGYAYLQVWWYLDTSGPTFPQ